MTPLEWTYLYEERAGIKEDSGIPREEAERQALEETIALYGPKPTKED
jgi:hypothetical protein